MSNEAQQLGQRVLVLAPFGRDAIEVCHVLSDARLDAVRCTDAGALCQEIRRGAGATLLAEEALDDEARHLLTATLAGQPAWSDFPLLVMISQSRKQGDPWQVVRGIEGTAYLSLIERPLHVSTLVSTVRTATQARRRQYQIRDELAARERAEEALLHLNETLEERVEERTQQVKGLVSALTLAEQKERRRISQILHDNLQQQLYGIQLKMNFARQDAVAGQQEKFLKNLAEGQEWLGQAIDLTRTLTVDLSPPILQCEGLTDTLRWLVGRMQELHGLEVELVAEHAFCTPDEDMRVLLFQIVRVLLFNVAKHAGTNRATVELHDLDNHVQIQVRDEGKGFDATAAEAARGGGFGLFSVRERLRLFGGDLKIDSAPGKGTRNTIDVPLSLEKAVE